MVLISVILPSYNYEEYISESIESVLNQSLRDLELIIVDDHSIDGSKEIIQKYASKDERIRAFFHQENRGVSKTQNDGVDMAKGRFVAFTSADDVWAKSKLEIQLRVLEEDNDLIVWSEGEMIDSGGRPTGEKFTEKMIDPSRPHPPQKSGYLFEDLIYGNFICTSSLILKKENIRNIKFDERLRYLEDLKFEIDLARKYKYYFVQEPLVRIRIHERSTAKDMVGYNKCRIIVYQYILEKYGNELPKELKAKVLFRIGANYSQINQRKLAKQFILKAMSVNLLGKDNIFRLTYALGNENGSIGKFLLEAYTVLRDFCLRLFKELSHSRGREFFNLIAPSS